MTAGGKQRKALQNHYLISLTKRRASALFPLYEPHSGQAGGTVKEGEKASHPIIETKLLLPLWLFFYILAF